MSVQNVPMLLGVFLTTLVALYGLGMLLSSLFLLFGREAWHLSNLLQEPVSLVSGFYFPVRALGQVVAAAASILPITLGLDAMRQLLFPAMLASFRFLSPEVELAILAVLAVLFLVLARRALAYFEALARREGRLSIRGQ
jgi:ABC-2 type transport system permease protein